MTVTIDASVLVAAGAADDPGHVDASRCLEAILGRGLAVHLPTLALVEVTAAIARRTGDSALAREAGLRLLQLPGLALHGLHLEAAADAATVAGRYGVRGADAVYIATARGTDSTLVSLDEDQLRRGRAIVAAATPSEWLTHSVT